MPTQKIIELMECVSKNDQSSKDVSNMLLALTASNNDPSKLSESLIMLFSIVDTNHKKNKQLILETLTVLMIIAQTLEKCQEDKKKDTSKPKKDKTTSASTPKGKFDKIVDAFAEAIKKSPTVSLIVALITILTVLYFGLFHIDSKAAEKTAKSVKEITEFKKGIK